MHSNLPEVTDRIISYQRYLNLANQYLALAKKGAWEEIIELEKVKSLHGDRPAAVVHEEGVPQNELDLLTDLLARIIKVMTEYESMVYAQRMHLDSLIKAADERENEGRSFGKVIRTGTYGALDLFGKNRK